jgi:hypothetical protein
MQMVPVLPPKSTSTKSAPFRLYTDARAHAPPLLTTDELRLAQLRARKAEEAKERRRLLHRLQSSPPVQPHASSPKITKPKPFRLAGTALHEAEVLNRHRMIKVCLLRVRLAAHPF